MGPRETRRCALIVRHATHTADRAQNQTRLGQDWGKSTDCPMSPTVGIFHCDICAGTRLCHNTVACARGRLWKKGSSNGRPDDVGQVRYNGQDGWKVGMVSRNEGTITNGPAFPICTQLIRPPRDIILIIKVLCSHKRIATKLLPIFIRFGLLQISSCFTPVPRGYHNARLRFWIVSPALP